MMVTKEYDLYKFCIHVRDSTTDRALKNVNTVERDFIFLTGIGY